MQVENKKKNAAHDRWVSENCTRVTMKFNHSTDADILAVLEGKAKQTEIKRLLRLALAIENKK